MANPFPNPDPFLNQIFNALNKLSLDCSNYELDHICYRVETLERYNLLKEVLASNNELLTETMIGGRPIATFKLKKPIVYKARNIGVLELPAPKPGSFYPEGWEHVEFVVGEDPTAFMKHYPELPFLTKGLSKPVNADVVLKFRGFAVKFHEHSLEYVIKYLD